MVSNTSYLTFFTASCNGVFPSESTAFMSALAEIMASIQILEVAFCAKIKLVKKDFLHILKTQKFYN